MREPFPSPSSLLSFCQMSFKMSIIQQRKETSPKNTETGSFCVVNFLNRAATTTTKNYHDFPAFFFSIPHDLLHWLKLLACCARSFAWAFTLINLHASDEALIHVRSRFQMNAQRKHVFVPSCPILFPVLFCL